MKNMFCDNGDLGNEEDVKSLLVDRLTSRLGYGDAFVDRGKSLPSLPIPVAGSKAGTVNYAPDRVLKNERGEPVVVVETKGPKKVPEAWRQQAAAYALVLNQKRSGNPVEFCVVTNGKKTLLYRWDEEEPLLELGFGDFELDNEAYGRLTSLVSFEAVNASEVVKDFLVDFRKPDVAEIVQCFDEVHKIIWRKDKASPTKAFYELVKLMFVKLRQDQLIRQRLIDGKALSEGDFFFSQEWISKQSKASSRYVSDTLFTEVRSDLEAQISAGNKKRIFGVGEGIDLTPETIFEVVGVLENFDLNEMDEDLNGRMFETFLSATVRGKELGQYFTPRSVVKYMTGVSENMVVSAGELPLVLDGCCGSGGFLIEAMAELAGQIENQSHLTNKQREAMKEKLKGECLWGIEANSEVARIARVNMYLHGDGGSRIYIADTLDKALRTTSGGDKEAKSHLKELREAILDERVLFDVVLTNPPFSTPYEKADEAEKKILDSYATAQGKTAKSNTLFLERYTDLLGAGGELLTVIDDTVLNGSEPKNKIIREFIAENYIIKQVLSLPFNAFVSAEAGVKTSVLHLRRKTSADEQQGDVFMAIAGNIGHDDWKRHTPELNGLPWIQRQYNDWAKTGKRPVGKPPWIPRNKLGNLGCQTQAFVVPAKKLSEDRWDAFYHSPELAKLKAGINRKQSSGTMLRKEPADFNIVKYLTAKERRELPDEEIFYVDVGSVGQDGLSAQPETMLPGELPDRAKIGIREGDVLFARNISSRGTTLLVPDWLDGAIASNGFIAIRPKTKKERLMLWSLFRSEIWRTQIYYLSTSAVQPEVKDNTFRAEMTIPWPHDPRLAGKIVRTAQKMADAYAELHKADIANRTAFDGAID